MKRLQFTLLTIFASVTMIFAQGQSVDELQAKYINALGGKEKITGFKNIFLETNMEVMGMQLPAKLWIVYGTASRQEVEIQGQKMITFIGKDRGWMINPLMGSTDAQPIPDEAVKGAEGTLIAGGELADYKAKGYSAAYEGKDSANGKEVHKIKLNKGDYESIIYLDVSSYYMIRNIAKTTVMGQAVEQITNFSDYEKTPEGFVFARNSIISNPMVGEIKSSITKIEVNASLDIKALENTN